MKRPLTEQERKDLREVVDMLYQLTDKVKNPKNNITHKELRGGIFPVLFWLAQLAVRAVPIAIRAAQIALPTLIRTGVQVGTRLLPSVARGAVQGITRALPRIGQTIAKPARGLLQKATQSTRGILQKGSTPAQTGQKLAGTSVRKGLLNKVGTAVNLAGASGVINDMMVGDETYDLPPDEQFPEYRETPFPTYAHEEGDMFQREFAPEVEIPLAEDEVPAEPEAQEETTFNLAPLRYTPRVRNVFTAAQSRNPLSSALQTTTLSATPASQPVRARNIGVFRGSGVVRRKRVMKKYGLKDTGYSLDELAEITGVSKSALQEVYNRGIGAYKTNPRSVRMKVSFAKNVDAPMKQKLSKEQWAMARVYSFLDGNPKHDTDLRGGMEHEAEEVECVNSPCGVHTFTTLKENGFPKIEVPEIASRLVKMEERGGLNDEVINDALEPYVAVNLTAGRGEVFSGKEVKDLLAQMKQKQLSGVLFLTGDTHPDHIVPVVYRDGKLYFVDEKETHEIKTGKSFYAQKWWGDESYGDVYEGVDRVVMMTPE